MATKPQKIATGGSSAWNNATTPKTVSVTVEVGDVIVTYGVIEGQATSSSDTLAITGGGETWSTAVKVNVAAFTHVSIQTTIATIAQTFNVSCAHTGNTGLFYGFNVTVWRRSTGIGTPVKTNTTSGAPSLAITTVTDNATIVVYNGDWSNQDGTSRVWLTINSVTPSAANGLEIDYSFNASHYVVYGAYWDDAGAAGSKTVGLSAPGSQKYSIVAVEVKSSPTPADVKLPNQRKQAMRPRLFAPGNAK